MKFEGPKAIKIKRNPKPGYFGIASYPNSTTTLSCQLSNKGGHNTGLTPDEEKHYESILNLKPGELSKHSLWWDNIFNVEHPIRLLNTKTTELTLDNPINQIKYKVLLAHSDVAKTEVEKNKPGILFYIDDEESKAKVELEALTIEYECTKLIFSLSPEEKKNALRMFGKTGVDTLGEDICSMYLTQEMKKNPKGFLEILTDKSLATKMFIYDLIEKKLLINKKNYFIYGDETIATSIDECVAFINNPKNQTIKLALQTKLKKSKGLVDKE